MINMVLPESSTHHLSITNVLDYCKSKIINPYLRLLSLMGLRPLIYEQHEPGCCTDVANFLYTSLVVLLMICGYVIQYMACFRRDRGFCQVRQQHQQQQYGELLDARAVNVTYVYEKTCDGSVLFTFITPSVLHLFGYIHAVMVFRGSDDDQLPILMERVIIVVVMLVFDDTSLWMGCGLIVVLGVHFFGQFTERVFKPEKAGQDVVVVRVCQFDMDAFVHGFS